MEKRFKNVEVEKILNHRGHSNVKDDVETFPRPLREKSALTPTLSHGRGSNSMRTDVSSRIAGEGLLKNVTSLPSYLPTLRTSKRAAFTLAEVLITLGIIGVVAALTLSTVISKYKKHVYYNQFIKAATILENAITSYRHDYACEGDNSYPYDSRCMSDFYNHFPEYVKVVKSLETKGLSDDELDTICPGYKKLPVSNYVNGKNREVNLCYTNIGATGHTVFITADGMLFNFDIDDGIGGGHTVDTNGPDKGPNAYGRDIFIFYLYNVDKKENFRGIEWGGTTEYEEMHYGIRCIDDLPYGDGCAGRLLKERKMNY